MKQIDFYWQHRCGDVYSPPYKDPTMLLTHSDQYFEDFSCIPFVQADKGNDLMLRTFGYRSCDPHYHFLNRISSRYSLHVILSGEAWVDGVAVHAGDITFFERNRMHNFSTSCQNPCHYAWVTFKNGNSESLLKEIGLSDHNKIYHTDNLPQICAVFYDMLYTKHSNTNIRLHLESCLIEILALSQNTEPPKESLPGDTRYSSSRKKYIEKALEFIEIHKAQNIKIEEISKAVGLNDKYFRNLFKQELGMSPLNYLIEKRIESAATLLKSTNYSISEIAEFVGFRDYRQFSELFKKKTGTSPSAYRSNRQK